MYSYGPPHMAMQKQDDQHEHTFSSYVRIRDVVLKIYQGRWTIGRSGERGSGISVLPARHDDDDDDDSIQHDSFICNTVKRLQVLRCNTDNSILHTSKRFQVFQTHCTQLNDSKYYHISLTIQLNISHLFTHN